MIDELIEGTDGEAGPVHHQIDKPHTFGFPGAVVSIVHRRPLTLQKDGSHHPDAWVPKGSTPDGAPHVGTITLG